MALPEVKIQPAVLKKSLQRLNAITKQAYNQDIQPIALDTWRKHLSLNNPQWHYINAKPFYVSDKDGSAHVMAMIDERLPEIGIVGYFACTNSEVGSKALNQACSWLKTRGLSDVYGPINGTLPSDYRLNLSDDYAFPGEPVNPRWHIDAFRRAGFRTFNRYASARLKHFKPLLKFVLRRPRKEYSSLIVRPFSNDDLKRDFKVYHELRNLIFPFQSIYCQAISLDERVYISSGKFDPNYTYFLVDKNREVGFVMAYEYKRQLVVKSIGLLPEYRGKRLSSLLLGPIHDEASKNGLTTAIYGMVRVGNDASRKKHPLARVFRKYITMHKSI